MLNNKKEFICFFVTLGIMCILVLFIIWDMIDYFHDNWYHKENRKLENAIQIQNMYIEVLKKAVAKDNNLSEEEIVEKTKEKETLENQQNNKLSNDQIVEEMEKIDIYSTNPWRIKIPKLKVDAPITEGTSQESLRRTVGHFEETDKWTGNVALAAHNRGYRCNFFQDIKLLEKGDRITYTTVQGERNYQVVLNQVIKETDWSYIQNTEDNRITLITCETNQRAYRRCIQAVEIK